MIRKFVLALLLALSTAGCGYTTGSLLPEHLKTIRVQPFRNKIQLTAEVPADQYRFRSYTPNLETDITKAVLDRFLTDGNLKIVEEANADLILTGVLVDYLRQPVRYGSDNEDVDEYRVSIICAVEVKDVRDGSTLWQDPRVIGDSTYNVSGTYAVSEAATIDNAVADLARRIVNRTIEGW
ncbi:LPS assembly lipoprotein LptE [Candidatus Omnitrophota bacterium]